MRRPIRAEISRSAIAQNLTVVKQHCQDAKVWAVVKADAYGHGLENVLSGLTEADGLALLELEEARRVRACGWKKPLLLLEGVGSVDELSVAAELGAAVVVHQVEQVAMLAQAKPARQLQIFLKINTGMNRLGLGHAAFIEAWQALSNCPSVSALTAMTHFADADGGGIAEPLRRFQSAVEGLHAPLCCANSATVLLHPQAHFHAVRAGIMLYGASPLGQERSAKSLGLDAVMRLRSRLISVQTLSAGESVGYGATFTAEQPMRLGVVACGYGDGYPRQLPSGTPLLVAGQRCPLVGRVSMDMISVDITSAAGAELGSEVELWGEGVSVDDVAHAAGTIGYQLLTGVTHRVPRVVVD